MKMVLKNGVQILPTAQESLIEQETWGRLREYYARHMHIVSWRARGTREYLEFIDPLVESWFGYPEENWRIPGFWAGRIHREDREAFFDFHRVEALRPGLHSRRYRMLTNEDELIWVEEVSCVRPINEHESLICGMFIDVSREQELTEEVVRISNLERERLGQDLHDDFCQNLAGIACLSRMLEKRLEKASPDHSSYAAEITYQINEALGQVRSLSHSLSPLQLQDSDLRSCLEKLIRDTEKRTGVSFRSALDDSVVVRSYEVRLHLYRLCQEAIQNAIRHGNATRVTVTLARGDNNVCHLTIEDDGPGFPDRPTSSEGLGIRLMKHRCQQFGGDLNLRNGTHGGAVVECAFSNS